jgi:hypothetical protein
VHEPLGEAPQPTDEPPRFPLSPAVPAKTRSHVYIGLLVLTIATTTLAGASQYYYFSLGFNAARNAAAPDPRARATTSRACVRLTVLAIPGATRWGTTGVPPGVDVTLPFSAVTADPKPLATGTFGAFIRFSRIPSGGALRTSASPARSWIRHRGAGAVPRWRCR